MMWIQVSGGKMHAVNALDENANPFTVAHVTECSREVRAANVFKSRKDALDYCGGREQYMCVSCTTQAELGG